MASVPHHRKAYGSHRMMSPTVKARNVVASIRTREQEGRPWSWSTYGLQANPAQQARVLAALGEVAFYIAPGGHIL